MVQSAELFSPERGALDSLIYGYLRPALRVDRLPGGAKRHWRQIAHLLWYGQERLAKELGHMAKNGRQFEFDQWVNIRLEDSDKDAIREVTDREDADQVAAAWIGAMAYAGYSISCVYDDYSSALQVSAVCKNPDDPNYGLGLSARHPEFVVAVISLAHKHEAVAETDWTGFRDGPKVAAWG